MMHGRCACSVPNNWQIIFFSITVSVTCCGELILRKSVSTLIPCYRWFILMLINVLSFLIYVLILVYRQIRNYVMNYNIKKEQCLSQSMTQQRLMSFSSNLSSKTKSKEKLTNSESSSEYLSVRAYISIALLESVSMLCIFDSIGYLPGNIVMSLPLLPMSICALLTELGCGNCVGCVLLAVSISYIVVGENSSYLTDTLYCYNLIVFGLGCVVLLFAEFYKRASLSKTKVDMIEFNLIGSLFSILILWLLSPVAFQMQFISTTQHTHPDLTSIWSSFQNIHHGIQCLLFGIDSYNSDQCNPSTLHLTMALLLTCMLCNRLSLRQILHDKSKQNKNSYIQHLTSISIICAFMLCYLDPMQNLWLVNVYITFNWKTLIITSFMSIGAYLTNRTIDQRVSNRITLENQWTIR
eukprot:333663_1